MNLQYDFTIRMFICLSIGSTVPIFAAENSPPRFVALLSWDGSYGLLSVSLLGLPPTLLLKTLGKLPGVCSLERLSSPLCPSPSASSSAPVCTVLHSQDFFSNVEPCSESPRWLMKKNRYPEAYHSLVRLRHTELQAARDLYYIHVQLQKDSESKIIPIGTYFDRLTELFINRRVRRATLASFVVMLAQQLCGINSKCIFIIFFYPC